MNIKDLKHKRKKSKIKKTLDQIDFRGIDPFFYLAQKNKRSKKVKKKNQEKEIFTNTSKIGS